MMTAKIWKEGARKLRGESIAARKFNLADRKFEADRELVNLLDDVFGDNWDDYTCDWYDRSIEVLGVGDRILSIPEAKKMWKAGFARMWTHVSSATHATGERIYGWFHEEDGGRLTEDGKK